MAGFEVPNLAYLRNIPVIGAFLFEALHGTQQAINTISAQGNLNPVGEVAPPPAIQNVKAVGDNGFLHVSIEHTAADVNRGVVYTIEHADNPGFVNPQFRQTGDGRGFSEFVGAQTRYVRAYASYPGSAAGTVVYHGGGATPEPVDAGGGIGPAPFLPSQGRSTGAPGQGGADSSPVQSRSDVSGFDWKLQRPVSTGGFGPGRSPGSENGIGSSSGTSGGSGIIVPGALYDTYANWTATKYSPVQFAVNTTFTITDWNFVTYIVRVVAGANKWVYKSERYDVTQATIPTTGFNGAALGANDAGLQIGVTDYAHTLKWSGSGWGWADGDTESNYFQDFGSAPTGNGWHACDGSVGVAYLKGDGTTGTRTLPNTVATPAYRKSAAAYSATISAAATPTVTIAAITPSGTNSAPTLSMNSYTPAGTISAPTFSGSSSALTTNLFTPVALATAALTSLGGSTTSYTPAGTVSTPTFSGTPATLTGTVSAPTFTGNSVTPTGTISLAPGDPVANYQAVTYFRQ